MATVTEPILLDSTGQDIVTKLNNINTQVTALNALIADLGLISITPISQADYNNLSPTDKLNGVFDIYDAVEPNIDGHKVSYDSNTNIIQKVDSLENGVTVLATSSGSKTHAQHIATLKAVWDTLTDSQKMKCMISRGGIIFVPQAITSATGRFNSVEIYNQTIYVEMIRMSNTSLTVLNGTTYQDISSSTINTIYTLYLP